MTVRAATEYLGCSRDELIAWVEPDRRMQGDCGPQSGARLWLARTLDAAKPNVADWRARDRAKSDAVSAKIQAEHAATTARRAGMRKGGALVASKVCAMLECSLPELNRWAADGRLAPDGEIFLYGLPKAVNARAWLPESLEKAKAALDDWRAQDQTKKVFKRRGLRAVG